MISRAKESVRKRLSIASLLASFAFAAPLLAQPAPGERSPRDLYVEAWFEETANADLAAALKLYQAVLDRAATSDRELAARALLRIGRIAEARGEPDAAKICFERLASEFDGTLAAKEAKERATESASTQGNETSAAIVEARRWLDEMLTNERDDSPRKAKSILEALGIDQVRRVYTKRGGNLAQFLGALDAALLTPEQWINFALMEGAYGDVLRVVLAKLIDRRPDRIPEAFTKRVAENATPNVALSFLDLCLAVGSNEAIAAADEVLGEASSRFLDLRYFEHIEYFQKVLSRLIETEAPDVSRLVATWVARLEGLDGAASKMPFMMRSGEFDLIRRLWEAVCSQTPGARMFWSRFARWHAGARINVVQGIVSLSTKSVPVEVIATWLEDPEPAIRFEALVYEWKRDDPERRRAAANALARETAPIEVGPLYDRMRDVSKFPIEAIEETKGALREYLYFLCYVAPAAVDALRFGLERGHVEAIHALFDPRFAETGLIISGGSRSIDSRSPLLTQNILRTQLAKDPDPDLLRKAVKAALAIDDPRLHLAAFRAVEGMLEDRAAEGIVDLFVELGSPRIDLEIMKGSRAHPYLSPTSKLRLLRSKDRQTRVLAIQSSRDSGPLREIVRDCDPTDFVPLFERAKALNDFTLALEILKRVDPRDELAVEVFLFSLPREAEALIVACVRGGDDGLGVAATYAAYRVSDVHTAQSDSVRTRVENALEGLALPESLRALLQRANREGAADTWLARVAEVLKANLEPWRQALVSREASRLLARAVEDSKRGVMYEGAADEIAALGAREFARDLLTNSDSYVRRLGLRALAVLGDREAIVAYSRENADPGEWLPALIRVGANDAILQAIRENRATRAEVARNLQVDTDPALMRGVLLAGAADLGIASSTTDKFKILRTLVDSLVRTGDVEMLMRAALDYEFQDAIDGLVQLGAWDRLLDEYPRLPTALSRAVFEALRARTGFPDPAASYTVEFRTEREALVAEWRQRLAK